MRKIVRGTEMSDWSMRQIAKKEFEFKPYKLQKFQLLTDENKRVRLQRNRQLKTQAADNGWEMILFTDEKLFTWNKRTTFKTTDAEQQKLLDLLPWSSTAKTPNRTWLGVEFAPGTKHSRFFLIGGVKN